MKTIPSILCLLLMILGLKTFAQSNLTWTLKDKGEKGFFKTHTSFNSNFSGFVNKEESIKFIAKVKSNPEVLSLTILKIDANGNCDVLLTMKETHTKIYYASMAQKLGFSYIQYNNQKKTPAQILEDIRNKKN